MERYRGSRGADRGGCFILWPDLDLDIDYLLDSDKRLEEERIDGIFFFPSPLPICATPRRDVDYFSKFGIGVIRFFFFFLLSLTDGWIMDLVIFLRKYAPPRID